MAYDVDSRPAAFPVTRARRDAARSVILMVAFGIAGALPLVLSLTFDVPFAVTAPVVLILAVLYWAAESESNLMERWTKGRNGESAVADALEALRWEQYIVFHDIASPDGSIDHLVSGPNGVFMVQTKSRNYLPVHLKKATRQASNLHDELGVAVTPVICVATRVEEPDLHDGVWIVGLDTLAPWIREQHNRPVERDRLVQFASLL
jgi:hypothetical protein